jgi:putative transposase
MDSASGSARSRVLAVCGYFLVKRLIRRFLNAPLGFRGVLPRRWVVERTFAWFTFCRRLCKDYEFLPQSTESWIYACMIRLMTRRLARASP